MDLDGKIKLLEKFKCFADEKAIKLIDERFFENVNCEQLPLVITEEYVKQKSLISERSDFTLLTKDLREDPQIDIEIENFDVTTSSDIDSFISYFNDRFKKIQSILRQRMELRGATSIQHLKDDQDSSIIGMVQEIYKTKNGNFIITVEDETSEIKVLAQPEFGEWVVRDEIIGIVGKKRGETFFAREIIWPDIPLQSEIKRFKEKAYIAFISDLQFGSKYFLERKFKKCIEWLKSNNPITQKLKYIFIVGDLVDGVGIYPGQKNNLLIKDIYKQYEEFSKAIEEIPDSIHIVILPGNHDAVRLAEPQPKIPKELLPDLYEKGNIQFATNPCYVILKENGVNIRVLLYHGYSYDDHINQLPKLRAKAYNNPHHCMIDFLKRRHLAPTYGVSPFAPTHSDNLVIDKVPDIFAMGHTHYFSMNTYKGTNIIVTGTFERETEYQKKVGHKPDPGKIAIIDLSTRGGIVKVF
jgi:DNA polymerase II small subunit